MEIYKKLLTIQQKINGLSKDSKGFNYQYVSGSKVLGAIKPLMNEQGLLLKQEIIKTSREIVTYKSKNIDKTEVLYDVDLLFTWIDTETGEKDENKFSASGMNGFDKGIGSALTYAERYFLLKYFHIATDEDDVDYYEEPKAPAPTAKAETGENKKELEDLIDKSIKMINAKYKDYEVDEMLKKLHKKNLKDCDQQQLKQIFKGVI